MTWNTYKMPNGDIELADWPARKNQGWTNIGWIITQRCNMGCPYCIGWKKDKEPATVVQRLGTERVIAKFIKLRELLGKDIYITISGGEPTLVKGLPSMCAGLIDAGFKVELHSNLFTGQFKEWVEAVSPRSHGVAQIMATYHGWRLDSNDEARNIYLRNFKLAIDAGLSCVLKTIVEPGKVKAFPEKAKWLRSLLPPGSPVLPWVFINGQPRGKGDKHVYPYAYTHEESVILASASACRRGSQAAYRNGAGWFQFMKCDAGRGYLYMNSAGEIFRCFTARAKKIGDLEKSEMVIQPSPKPCGYGYCSTPFWGLWYGLDPWHYVPGLKQEDCTFCRFGPKVG